MPCEEGRNRERLEAASDHGGARRRGSVRPAEVRDKTQRGSVVPDGDCALSWVRYPERAFL
jgi:hypothetical protein